MKNPTKKTPNLDYKEITNLVEESYKYGSTLFITDEKLDDINVKQVNPHEIEDINGMYDCVIINTHIDIQNKQGSENTELFLKCISHVKKGGKLAISRLTYENIPEGRKVIEGLVKTLKLRIEVPPSEYSNIILASKT